MRSVTWIRGCAAGSLLPLAWCASAAAQATTMESATSEGLCGRSAGTPTVSLDGDLSADGRFVVFVSPADNFVPGDTNGKLDVFVRDRLSGATERASVGAGGVQGNEYSNRGAASGDGRYIAFQSQATNLVTGDNNGRLDIFVRDRQLGTTERVSVSSAGVEANHDSREFAISPDGRFVVFASWASNLAPQDTTNIKDVFLRDRLLGTTELISLDTASGSGNDISDYPIVSADGRYVSFDSFANDLVPGDAWTGWDTFVRDRVLGTTELIDVSSQGVQGSSFSNHSTVMSSDGRYVAFSSYSSILVPGDTNGKPDVFVRDRASATTERVSVSSLGAQADHGCLTAGISADGRHIGFWSAAANLSPLDTTADDDVFVHDRLLATTTLASLSGWDAPIMFSSSGGRMSADGRFVAFWSDSGDVTFPEPATCPPPSPCNPTGEVFVRDLALSATPMVPYCVAKLNSAGCTPRIGANGAPYTSGNDAFFVVAVDVLPQKAGLLIWGTQSGSAPFFGGTLCIQPPITRTPGQVSVGTTGCTGAYSFHFSQAYMAAHALGSGLTLFGQYWSRDPGFAPPNNVGLTNGIQFTLIP